MLTQAARQNLDGRGVQRRKSPAAGGSTTSAQVYITQLQIAGGRTVLTDEIDVDGGHELGQRWCKSRARGVAAGWGRRGARRPDRVSGGSCLLWLSLYI
jgi:hypothetical protein